MWTPPPSSSWIAADILPKGHFSESDQAKFIWTHFLVICQGMVGLIFICNRSVPFGSMAVRRWLVSRLPANKFGAVIWRGMPQSFDYRLYFWEFNQRFPSLCGYGGSDIYSEWRTHLKLSSRTYNPHSQRDPLRLVLTAIRYMDTFPVLRHFF